MAAMITVTLLLLTLAIALATEDKHHKSLGEHADAYDAVHGANKGHELKKGHSGHLGSHDNVRVGCRHGYGLEQGGYSRDRHYGLPSYVPRHHGSYLRY